MHLLYVDSAGRVWSGRLTTDPSDDGPPALVSRTGRPLPPSEVLAILTPRRLTADQHALLWRAVGVGYRVEGGDPR